MGDFRLKRFDDGLPNFEKRASIAGGTALRDGARDILVKAKRTAPFKDGALRRESDIKIKSKYGVQVRFWVEYAAYQERGKRRDGSRVIRNYSTSGTGAHYLENAGKTVSATMPMIFKKHLGAVS